MVIYNVTVKVDAAIAEQWLQWMQHEHAPAIINTACFSSFRIVKLLEVDDTEGPTYAVQYSADSMELYQQYIAQHADHFRQQSFDKWGNRFMAFRTLMQVIH